MATPPPADAFFDRCVDRFARIQDRIVEALEALDGEATFLRDDWTRDDEERRDDSPVLGGWGRTRVLEGGRVLEKAGVNLSCVHGRFTPEFAERLPGNGREFRASGVSLVLHPRNPHVPIVHMNYRRLSRGDTGWFGGGADLTPIYLDEQDATHFHDVHRAVCEAHPAVADYATFKQECDRYFHLPHRGEARGVGGIFFDYLRERPEECLAFVHDAGNAFLDAWLPIATRHLDRPYTDEERQWQLLRRGRYVEFNLVWDRGTQFGLRTGGRIESILMSLPGLASWRYDHRPAQGTREAALLDVLRSPREWASPRS
ncbi:MAG: oxygen-dependent coproporphyrinogen oxidase [Deltaproteobacteria bacterium]|nr:MAG: oxygen-dependent coproporphyrinogen oxidase [Deltaproteobacteria bacterium]